MWIKEKINQLKERYNTDCSYQLAEYLKIHVIHHDLHHEINGYYKYDCRNQYIVINENLDQHKQRLVCAHELGHALLHKHVNTPFMKSNTFLSVSKIEREANCFAAELLIPDESFCECESIYDIASLHNVPVELVQLKRLCKGSFFNLQIEHTFLRRVIMARFNMTKTKLDSIYWYKHNSKKTFAYRYKYYDKFGKRREKTKQGFDSIEKVERALIEIKANVLDGNESFVENENITVQQLNELYIQSTSATWKPTSERNHRFVMENYILPAIGHYKAKNINNIIIQNEIFNALIEKELKIGSLMSIYQRLNAVFSFAVKNEILPRKKFTTPNLKNAKESVKRHAFSIEEMEFILETLRTKYKITHYTAVALLFLTGMRIGEMRALTWDDIDFKKSVIHINKTKDRYGARNPKTTNSYRQFPMNNSIIHILTDYKDWYDVKMKNYSFRNPNNHVFVKYAGNPLGENYLRRIIELLCKREGFPHFTPHYLRHTFVTIQLLNNVPVTTVAALIGDTPNTVHKVYAHSLPKNERDASLKMDELINFESFNL